MQRNDTSSVDTPLESHRDQRSSREALRRNRRAKFADSQRHLKEGGRPYRVGRKLFLSQLFPRGGQALVLATFAQVRTWFPHYRGLRLRGDGFEEWVLTWRRSVLSIFRWTSSCSRSRKFSLGEQTNASSGYRRLADCW